MLSAYYYESSGWTGGKHSTDLLWLLNSSVAAIPALVYLVERQLVAKHINAASVFYPQVYNRHLNVSHASRVDFVPLMNGFGAQECNGYLSYIVTNYHNLPDLTIFLHAKPLEHNPHILDYIRLILKDWSVQDIGFLHLNDQYYPCHDVDHWGNDFWATAGFLQESKPPCAMTMCCSQFFVSRSRIHLRPRWFYENLLELVYESRNCAFPELIWHMIFGESAELKEANKVLNYPISAGGNSISKPTNAHNPNTLDTPFLTLPLGKVQKEMINRGVKFAGNITSEKIKFLLENDFGNSRVAKKH